VPTPQTCNHDEPFFRSWPMNQLDLPEDNPAAEWLWHGLIGRGNVTLLTSRWKAGKTTLITGLLQRFSTAGSPPRGSWWFPKKRGRPGPGA
jgi:hypothetical protein